MRPDRWKFPRSCDRVPTLWEVVGTLWEPPVIIVSTAKGRCLYQLCCCPGAPGTAMGLCHGRRCGRFWEVTSRDDSSISGLCPGRFELSHDQRPWKPGLARTSFGLRSGFPLAKVIL